MQDIVEIDGKTLIIRLPLQEPVRSKSSGKTLVIASTHGTITTATSYHGNRIVVTANAFFYPTKKPASRRTGEKAARNPAKAVHPA
jgi:hypothetical protein